MVLSPSNKYKFKYFLLLILQVNITVENVEMVFNNLTEIVGMTTESSDQNADNIQVISSVIFETASLLDESSTEGNIEPAVIEMVSFRTHSSLSCQIHF